MPKSLCKKCGDDCYDRNWPNPRSHTENAVTAAFREVFGWCPVRDGTSRDTVVYGVVHRREALPKTVVDPDEIDRRVA